MYSEAAPTMSGSASCRYRAIASRHLATSVGERCSTWATTGSRASCCRVQHSCTTTFFRYSMSTSSWVVCLRCSVRCVSRSASFSTISCSSRSATSFRRSVTSSSSSATRCRKSAIWSSRCAWRCAIWSSWLDVSFIMDSPPMPSSISSSSSAGLAPSAPSAAASSSSSSPPPVLQRCHSCPSSSSGSLSSGAPRGSGRGGALPLRASADRLDEGCAWRVCEAASSSRSLALLSSSFPTSASFASAMLMLVSRKASYSSSSASSLACTIRTAVLCAS
mmetsp:Transcript_13057/g.33714  ORF Transcript_13057/g.33714 Transcript_13057/m.33714 type:complete len:277 (+) Transcript_13057:166-996(+)